MHVVCRTSIDYFFCMLSMNAYTTLLFAFVFFSLVFDSVRTPTPSQAQGYINKFA